MSEQECFWMPPMVTLNKQLFLDTRHLLNVSSYSQTITVLQINKEFRSCTAVPPESLFCSCSVWREEHWSVHQELVDETDAGEAKMVVLYRNAIVLIGFINVGNKYLYFLLVKFKVRLVIWRRVTFNFLFVMNKRIEYMNSFKLKS